MARMIDADALKDNMFGYAPPEMMWDRGDIEHKIDEQPTIDAIPVEWLEKQASEQGPYSVYCQAALEILLDDWQKEQEAR